MNTKTSLVGVALLLLAPWESLEAHEPAEPRPLIKVSQKPVPPHPPDSSILREVAVEVDLPLARDPETKKLLLPVFSGPPLLLIRDDDLTPSRKESVIWSGHVDGQPASMVTLVVGKEILIGNVATQPTSDKPAEYYGIRWLGNRLHVLWRIDATLLPLESDPDPPESQAKGDEPQSSDFNTSRRSPLDLSFPPFPPSAHVGIASKASFRRGPSLEAPPPTCSSDTGSTIDVLVVYTPKAAQAENGADAIEQAIDLAIREINRSYARSAVKQRLELVHVQQVEKYVEVKGPTSDWRALQRPGGKLADVHSIRADVRADIVGLLVEYTEADLSSCGQAKVMESVSPAFKKFAFAAVTRRCAYAPGKWTLAHEFGHLMGGRHNWATDKKDVPFRFSHGYVQHSSPGHPAFRTLMSTCKSCDRVPYWSNPDIPYPASGDAMGSNDENEPANNAMTLNKTAETVAKFQCSTN